MKRLNLLFVIVLALLLFQISWDSFNEAHALRSAMPFYSHVLKDEHRSFSLALSTHPFEKPKELVEDIIEFLVDSKHPSSISVGNVDESGTRTNTYFISKGTVDSFEHLLVYENDSQINFSDEKEKKFLSNDLNDDASHHIKYLDQSYHQIHGEYPRFKHEYRPIHHLLLDGGVLNFDTQLLIEFSLPDKDVEDFKEEIIETLLQKHGMCRGLAYESCMEYEFFETTLNHQEIKGIFMPSVLKEPLTMPNPILFLSSITLVITSYVQLIKDKKENTIRKLHGNSDGVISKRIVLPMLIQSLVAFFSVLMGAYFLKVKSFDTLAIEFLKHLAMIGFVFALLMVSVIFIISMSIAYKNKVSSIKTQYTAIIPFVLSSLIKVFAVVLLAIPLIETHIVTKLYTSTLKLVSEDKLMLDSVLIQDPIQPMLPGQGELESWDREAEEIYKEIVRKYNLQYTDISHYGVNTYSYGNSILPYAIVDKGLLEYYEFTLNHQKQFFSKEEENFVLVPAQYKDDMDAKFINVMNSDKIYFTDKTPAMFVNASASAFEEPIVDPILFVMVDDYSMFNSHSFGIRKYVSNSTEKVELENALSEINETIATTSSYSAKEAYKVAQENLKVKRMEVVHLFLLFSLVTLLFSYLKIVMYFELKGRDISIKTLHGHSYIRRYAALFFEILIALLPMFYLFHRYNNFLESQLMPPLNFHYLVLAIGYAVSLEVIILLILIKRYQKNNIATMLKGSD